jgi:hypothetical protein
MANFGAAGGSSRRVVLLFFDAVVWRIVVRGLMQPVLGLLLGCVFYPSVSGLIALGKINHFHQIAVASFSFDHFLPKKYSITLHFFVSCIFHTTDDGIPS